MSDPVTFIDRADRLLGTSEAAAVNKGMRLMTTMREEAVEEFPIFDELRDRARAIRLHAISHLDRLLSHFADQLTEAGGTVHFASNALEANRIVSQILSETDSRLVVKAKSMVSEEIELNAHLEKLGVEVVETDLGEFIIQLAEDTPSHIVAPVLHKTRQDVGQIFADKLGVEYSDDPAVLNQTARDHMREVFLNADAGISGVNFAVAESGSLVLVTNEGNGRLTTTAPRVHIALMGMERIVSRFEDAAVLLEVLARLGYRPRLSVYTNVITRSQEDRRP